MLIQLTNKKAAHSLLHSLNQSDSTIFRKRRQQWSQRTTHQTATQRLISLSLILIQPESQNQKENPPCRSEVRLSNACETYSKIKSDNFMFTHFNCYRVVESVVGSWKKFNPTAIRVTYSTIKQQFTVYCQEFDQTLFRNNIIMANYRSFQTQIEPNQFAVLYNVNFIMVRFPTYIFLK